MNALFRTAPFLLAALAAGCERTSEDKGTGAGTPKAADAHPAPAAGVASGKTAKPSPPAAPELPKFGPLTVDTARAVLHESAASLGPDDVSRQALLYLADIGDRSAVKAIEEQLLVTDKGAYDDLEAAGIGAEALVALGVPGAVEKALAIAQQAVENDEPNEYVVHALSRIQGGDRAAAIAALVKIAESDSDESASGFAVETLAQWAAPEARETFAHVAANFDLEPRQRASAIAGLLRLSDPRGKELAQKLVDAVNSGGTDAPAADEVLGGFGIEGAVETVPYIRKIVDHTLADDMPASEEVAAAAAAVAVIHAKTGGADVVAWLHQLSQKDEGEYAGDLALPLYVLGDNSARAILAEQLPHEVANYAVLYDMSTAVRILDAVAERGDGAEPPLLEIVGAAAQVRAPKDAHPGVNDSLRSLNLAAAHAFLKSSAGK